MILCTKKMNTHTRKTNMEPKSWRFGKWFSCSTEWSLRAPSSSLHSASSSSMNYHYAEWVPHSPLRKTDMQIISFLFGPSKHPTKCKNMLFHVVSVGWFQIITWETPNLHVQKRDVWSSSCACVSSFGISPRFLQLRLFGRFMTIIHIHPRKYKSIWAPTNCK